MRGVQASGEYCFVPEGYPHNSGLRFLEKGDLSLLPGYICCMRAAGGASRKQAPHRSSAGRRDRDASVRTGKTCRGSGEESAQLGVYAGDH